MGIFHWRYMKKRVNENKKTDLPKSRKSKEFKTKEDAKSYWKEKGSDWLQASLYEFTGIWKIVGRVTTKGEYDEKYL